MSTTIKLKSSTVAGKIPAAGDLVSAELAINLADQKLYSKDVNGEVFEVGGASVGQGPTPPPNGNEIGDLWWDGDFLLVWNGSDWEVVGGVTSVNGETGDVILNLGDLNDVNLSLGVSNGDIIAWNGSAWVNTAAPPADISGSSINDLNDVDTVGADDGDILVWNESAGEWQATDRGTVPENTSDLNNDGENGTDPFITEAEVNNILAGNNIDGTPNPGTKEYLQSGDNVSELVNDAGYITDAGVTKIIAGDSIEITPAGGTGEVTLNVAIDASGVVINLDDLDDVNVPSPDPGDVLAYDGSEWVSAAAPPADISGSSINQLNDVDAAGANNGDMLIWDGTNWVNVPAPTKTSDLTNDGENGADPFITEGEVSNILNGLNPDGTPNPGSEGYLKPGDNVSELYNDAGYITDTDTAADSNKLCGEDCDYYLNYQNFINTPDLSNASLWVEDAGKLYPKTLSNNVGIGTDEPEAKLDVSVGGNNSTPQPSIQWGRDSGSVRGVLGHGLGTTNGIYLDSPTGQSIAFQVSGNEKARISSNGNVGIGTDNPQTVLDVDGTASVGTRGDGNELLKLNNERTWSFFQVGTGASAHLDLRCSSNKNFTVSAPKSGDSEPTSNLTVLGNNGNVGIGTDNPKAKLDVNGDIIVQNVKNASALATDANGKIIAGSSGNFSQWDDVTGGINYADGNVGIGTTNPQAKLDVNGLGTFSGGVSVTGGDINGPTNLSLSAGTDAAPAADQTGRIILKTKNSLIQPNRGLLDVYVNVTGTQKNTSVDTNPCGIRSSISSDAGFDGAGSQLICAFQSRVKAEGTGNALAGTYVHYNAPSFRSGELAIPANLYGFRTEIKSTDATNVWGVYSGGDAANYFKGNTYVAADINNPPYINGSGGIGVRLANGGTMYSTVNNTGGSNANIYIVRTGNDVAQLLRFTYTPSLGNAGTQAGKIVLDGANAVKYSTSSDYRLKENITSLPNAIERVKQLNTYQYNFIGDTTRVFDGFLAHELAEVVPRAVSGTKDETEAIGTLADYNGTVLETEVTEPSAKELEYTEEVETNGVATTVTRTRSWTPTGTRPLYQGVDHSKLIPLLTKALQEALERIETLESLITS